jgi:hypothetical protein
VGREEKGLGEGQDMASRLPQRSAEWQCAADPGKLGTYGCVPSYAGRAGGPSSRAHTHRLVAGAKEWQAGWLPAAVWAAVQRKLAVLLHCIASLRPENRLRKTRGKR